MPQLSDLRTRLAERLRVYDSTISADQTVLNFLLNDSQREICSKWDWSFLKGLDFLQTNTDITTGTVTATNAATAITFSTGPTPSVANRFIQTSDSDDWYEISAHTAGATAATLSDNYVGSGGSGKTFTVRQVFYSLASDVDKVISVAQSISPRQLVPLTQMHYNRNFVFTTATGTTDAFMIHRLDSSGNLQLTPYPFPDATILLWIWYKKRTTDMSATTDKGNIPEKYHHVLLDLATAYGLDSIDDSRADKWFTKAYAGVQEMKMTDGMNSGEMRVMHAIDQHPSSSDIIFKLPPEYGPEGI